MSQADNPAGTGPMTLYQAAGQISELFSAPDEDTGNEEPVGALVEEQDVEDEPIEESDGDDLEDEIEGDDDEPGNLHTVRVDGEELQVPYDELVAGYSRHAHFTRQSQALAEERRTFQTERDAVRQEREQYAAVLPQLATVLEQAAGPEPDPAQFTDRAEYLYAKLQWNSAQAKLQAVRAEEQRIAEQRQAEQRAQMQAFLAEQQQKLAAAMPAWSDPGVASREQAEIADYLRGMGYQDGEIAQLYDHRAVLIANKARLYDKLQADGRLKAKPPKGKTAAPGSGDARMGSKRLRDQRTRAIKSGKVEDFAPLFARALGE